MTTAPKILAFAASARKASFNKQLIKVGATALRDAGAMVTLIDMADYDAPLYNGDLEAEQGLPLTMKAFKAQLNDHDGYLIASPEYNGFFPALIKNAFDWCTRPETSGEDAMSITRGKFAGLMSASPGGLGGIRALPRLRDCMAEYGIMTATGFATLPGASQAFNNDGTLKSEQDQSRVDILAQRLIHLLVRT